MSITSADTQISREHLRTFHIAGRGLDHLIPAAPLEPVVLDELPHAPRFASADLGSLHADALASSRGKARADFLQRIKQAYERLKEILAADDGQSPASLGSGAGTFFNANALAEALQEPANRAGRIDPERRARIETTLATLAEALRESAGQPPFWLLESIDAQVLDFCDRQLERFAVVLRALRVARLEIGSAFDPSIHNELLNRFDWQTADAEELAALPAIVVMETAERLAQMSLTAFGRLLRSGRPVQILVTCSGLYADDLSGYMPDFGYLAIAHREAFVLQSSLANPGHLRNGLAEMTRALRPAVAVVSILETPLLHLSRAFPLFRYDPDHGETWSERFELVVEPTHGLTAAHAAATLSDFRHHFRVIPDSAWNDEQLELPDYLTAYQQHPPLAIPFLWVMDQQGVPQRAILTRELVNMARDRGRAWRIFEELAGVKNAYVEAAVTQTRREEHETARREGATQAIRRVIALLTG